MHCQCIRQVIYDKINWYRKKVGESYEDRKVSKLEDQKRTSDTKQNS